MNRAFSINFSATRILAIMVYSFPFVVYLDWVAGFSFFENNVAQLVWKLLGATAS